MAFDLFKEFNHNKTCKDVINTIKNGDIDIDKIVKDNVDQDSLDPEKLFEIRNPK